MWVGEGGTIGILTYKNIFNLKSKDNDSKRQHHLFNLVKDLTTRGFVKDFNLVSPEERGLKA